MPRSMFEIKVTKQLIIYSYFHFSKCNCVDTLISIEGLFALSGAFRTP